MTLTFYVLLMASLGFVFFMLIAVPIVYYKTRYGYGSNISVRADINRARDAGWQPSRVPWRVYAMSAIAVVLITFAFLAALHASGWANVRPHLFAFDPTPTSSRNPTTVPNTSSRGDKCKASSFTDMFALVGFVGCRLKVETEARGTRLSSEEQQVIIDLTQEAFLATEQGQSCNESKLKSCADGVSRNSNLKIAKSLCADAKSLCTNIGGLIKQGNTIRPSFFSTFWSANNPDPVSQLDKTLHTAVSRAGM